MVTLVIVTIRCKYKFCGRLLSGMARQPFPEHHEKRTTETTTATTPGQI